MAVRSRRLRTVLMAGMLVMALTGCGGISQNPSYVPQLLPFGDIVRTHARPAGRGYFANFDPHAVKLVVRPLESCSPAQTQQVLIATVYDEKGQPRRDRRVEWLIEGVGHIAEVDESGIFNGRGYKVDNRYAVSYTDYLEHHMDRGTANPNDDFVIRPGQSWCVITSAVEGDTHVTVFAPEINNWQERKQVITHHWVNARWTTPPNAGIPMGSSHVLTTRLFRPTDNQPLANYRVRYRLVGGPPAVLLPARAQEFVAISDLRGDASVTLEQVQPVAGSSKIAVEIIRAPDPSATSDAGIIVSRTETTIDWLTPAVSLNLQGPPNVRVGEEASYRLAVNNLGRLESRALTVRYPVPAGYEFVRSDPPALVQNNELIWTLGHVPAGGSREFLVVFRSTRPTRVASRATVVTGEGQRDEQSVSTDVVQPGLKVAMTGPTLATLNTPLAYQIVVENPGSGPLDGIVLTARLDDGLRAEAKANTLEMRLETPLGPGEKRTIPLLLTPSQVGDLSARVEARGGNLSERAGHVVKVLDARLSLQVVGPEWRYVGRPATFALTVTNPGKVALDKVVLRQNLPTALEFVRATDEGRLTGRDMLWTLGRLEPGAQKTVQLTVNGLTPGPAIVGRASVSGEPVLVERLPAGSTPLEAVRAEGEAKLEIRGLPALNVDVKDRDDPLEVSGRTVYTIEVANRGSLRGTGIQVEATLSPELRFEGAFGPSEYRLDGNTVKFVPRDGLEPNQKWTYTIEVTALKPGDARVQVRLRSATQSEPLTVQQSTTLVSATGESTPARSGENR